MHELPTRWRTPALPTNIRRYGWGVLLFAAAGCGTSLPGKSPRQEVTLRVGVARAGSASALNGLAQVVQNLSTEGLARIGENGRPEPSLAAGWNVPPDGLSMEVRLRPGVRFHNGVPVDAGAVVKYLNKALPQWMGPTFGDVKSIQATDANRIDIIFRRPSSFLQEALEVRIREADHPEIGTGPFHTVAASSLNELVSNRDYYLGSPNVDRILLTNYPSVRAAWADMLRGRVDMLYELNADALSLMENANSVSTFSFVRPYQYMVALNVQSPQLRQAAIRRALNLAIDREALVRDGLGGHGVPSFGPISTRHWSFNKNFPGLVFDSLAASRLLSEGAGHSGSPRLRFTCLVPPDYERVALVVQRQLEAVGVTMDLREASADEAIQALGKSTFEAVILDAVEGPSLFRTYQWWHSGGSLNPGALGSPVIDAALDRIRYAASDDEYRNAAEAFQRVTIADPPAIFLAWGERARAVSRRFDVPAEPGRDILTTLRLWRPVADEKLANRN